MLSPHRKRQINLRLGDLCLQVGTSKTEVPMTKVLKTLANGDLGDLGDLFRPLHTRACAHARTIRKSRKKVPKVPQVPKPMEKQRLMEGDLRGDLKMKVPQGPHAPIG